MEEIASFKCLVLEGNKEDEIREKWECGRRDGQYNETK